MRQIMKNYSLIRNLLLILTSYISLIIVKIKTKTNVPIMEVGFLGENERQVRIEITKK